MDPIHQYKDGWYFWDETWTFRHGPYSGYYHARVVFNWYCKEYLN